MRPETAILGKLKVGRVCPDSSLWRNSLSRRSSGAAISYVYSVTQIIVSLVYVPMLLGAIGQGEYGLYQMIGSIIAYLNVINNTLSAGATRYYCRYAAVEDADGMANVLGTLKRIYRFAGMAIIGVTIVLAFVMRQVYAASLTPWELDESCILLGILAVNLLFTMSNTLSIAVITARERFVFLKGSQLAVLVIQPLAILTLVNNWPYAWTVCAVQLACNVACWAVQRHYACIRLGMDDRLREYDRGLERDLMRFSGGIILAMVADQVFWKTDQLILGWMYGTDTVAVYAVGAQVVMSYMPLGTTVSAVFMPKASEIWHRDHDVRGLSDLLVRVGRLSLYPSLLVLTGWVVFGLDFVKLWAGPGFADAYWIALVVMIPFTIDMSQNTGLTILQVRDMYGFRGKMYLVAAILNIGLTFVLARAFGGIGAAVSSGIAMFLSSGVILNWYYWKHVDLDIPRFFRSTLRLTAPLAVLCAAGCVVWALVPKPVGWAILAVGILVYAAAFCAVAWVASCNEYERSFVRRLAVKLGLRKAG